MQWYKTYRGEERLKNEIEALSYAFPQMNLGFLDDGTAMVSGFIGPSQLLGNSYFVVAEFPYTYGDGSRIIVFLPEEKLLSGTPHVYSDDEICLEHNNFTPKTDAISVLGWTIEWLGLYEEFLETGKGW